VKNYTVQGGGSMTGESYQRQLKTAAVYMEAHYRAAAAAGADFIVHDEFSFTGPDAEARAALYKQTLALEYDICGFEQWQKGRHAYNRLMAAAMRVRLAALEVT
jgi:prophage maintenance system killer protein